MTSTAIERVPLGASTLNRKWYLDIDTGYGAGPITATADATTDQFTANAHGLTNGEGVTFSGTLPAPLTAGTTYYVINAAANTFQVATTVGGTAVDLTAAGTVTVTPGVSWTGVFGIGEFQPTLDSTLQDDSDFDSDGYKSQTKTAEQWAATFKVSRKTQKSAPANYDPGQEALRLAADEMGPDNTVHVRWYEMNGATGPKVEAYEGYAAVAWAPDGGGMDALSTVTVTLTGQGKRIPITHPAAGA